MTAPHRRATCRGTRKAATADQRWVWTMLVGAASTAASLLPSLALLTGAEHAGPTTSRWIIDCAWVWTSGILAFLATYACVASSEERGASDGERPAVRLAMAAAAALPGLSTCVGLVAWVVGVTARDWSVATVVEVPLGTGTALLCAVVSRRGWEMVRDATRGSDEPGESGR